VGSLQAVKLLLDTHILLWSLLEPARLTERVAAALEDPSNELWFSPIVLWEVLMLAERGRVTLAPDAATWVRRACQAVPFREAPMNHEVAIQSRAIDLLHEDPADRFLVATALVYDLTLVTADERLLRSRRIAALANT
jgi:PIN domain nuclease of toxin-antitoxin system